jgi:peptidoglycan/LPS O-acetylase OafA/YrhL
VIPVPQSDWTYLFTLCRLDGLAIGALIAVLLATARPLLEAHRTHIALGAAVLGAGLLVEAKWKGALGVFVYTWLATFYGSVLLLAVLGSPIAAFLRARVLRFFGDISYSLYFVHVPMLALCTAIFVSPDANPLSQRPVICSLLAIVLSIGIAWLSRQHVERPAIEAVRGFTARRPISSHRDEARRIATNIANTNWAMHLDVACRSKAKEKR